MKLANLDEDVSPPERISLGLLTILKVATWNTCGYNEDTDIYIDARQHLWDIMCLTELRGKHTARESARTIVSAPTTCNDDASGCMIKLSTRASKLLVLSGHSGSRIDYVKLRGTVTNLWVFCVYLPHGARSQPSHEDTLRELEKLCQTLPQRRDLVMVMGDLNAKLAQNTQGYTGTSSPHKSSNPCGVRTLNFMQARDTFFCLLLPS